MTDPRLAAFGIVDIDRSNEKVFEKNGVRYFHSIFGDKPVSDATAVLMTTAYEMGQKDQGRAERVTELLRRASIKRDAKGRFAAAIEQAQGQPKA